MIDPPVGRRRAGQNLELTRVHFESILQTTSSAVICLSPQRRILVWNRGAELIFGYVADEVLGLDYFEHFITPNYQLGVGGQFDRLLAGDATRNYENPVRTRDGALRTVLWNASPLLSEEGETLGIVAIGQDVTELKRAQVLQAGENRALELLAQGAPIGAVLSELALTLEAVCPGVQAVVMLADSAGRLLHCVVAPSISEAYRRAIDGVSIELNTVGCGRAAFLRELVVTAEIDQDASWGACRHSAILEGLRACWSQPISNGMGRVLGTLDVYTSRPRRPTATELEAAERAARLAGIAIEHRRVHEEQIQASEELLQSAVVELEELREELRKNFSFEDIVAVSPAMLGVIQMAAQVAPTDATVLITGETGTGKEVLAKAIHANGSRQKGPFVAVNCGAIPETLMESELFGHERGAFTGADRRKPGQIERARGGTLFLDEVGELIPSAQVKLLRVLQERTFERLGGSETLPADIRVIAATNRDLAKDMQRGRFRDDLFYRLNVFQIHIPPLRERREAIPTLSEKILRRIAEQLGRPEIGLSKVALQLLEEYEWKGNVRELQNALERAAILCGGSLIGDEHLPIRTEDPRPARRMARDTELVVQLEEGFSLEKLEAKLVRQAMAICRGNKSKAARLLGISRGSLRWRLQKPAL